MEDENELKSESKVVPEVDDTQPTAKRRVGRPPLGARALSSTERVANWRARRDRRTGLLIRGAEELKQVAADVFYVDDCSLAQFNDLTLEQQNAQALWDNCRLFNLPYMPQETRVDRVFQAILKETGRTEEDVEKEIEKREKGFAAKNFKKNI